MVLQSLDVFGQFGIFGGINLGLTGDERVGQQNIRCCEILACDELPSIWRGDKLVIQEGEMCVKILK